MKRKRLLWLILCVATALLAGFCLWRIAALGRALSCQQAAQRWQGESEKQFAQVSCFVPVDEALSRRQIESFRGAMIGELSKTAQDNAGVDGLWRDAWSAVGRLTVYSDTAKADASVIAVGGNFFDFHPLRLLSGDYLHENDLMQDRLLLDSELAWHLFGGTQLQGMHLKIDGHDFLIAGVVERENDAASLAAYTAGQGLYMSYDSFAALTGQDAITSYEFILAEPVDGFALKIAKDRFPVGRGEIVQNTGRFGYGRLWSVLKNMDRRAMQSMGIIYPYWENAALMTENRCARLLLAAALLLILPLVSLAILLWRLLKRAKEGAEEKLIPRAKDAVEEAFRRPARRRWEKKHRGEQ